MFKAYVIVTLVAAAANIYAASNDFRRLDWVLANMNKLGIAPDWLHVLGLLKAAGAIGLLAGIYLPLAGLVASIGLVFFFVGAVIVTIRSRWYKHLPYPLAWLALAVGSLVLRIALP